jgi:hypothetical protein
LAVCSLFPFLKHQPLPETHEIVSNHSDNLTENQNLTQNQKIDLGDVLDELSFTAIPLTEFVPAIDGSSKNSFDDVLLKFPVEPIVHFTNHPLEATLTFLETARIIRSTNHERD